MTVTLADGPARGVGRRCVPGVDAVWLMGVWERSPASRRDRTGRRRQPGVVPRRPPGPRRGRRRHRFGLQRAPVRRRRAPRRSRGPGRGPPELRDRGVAPAARLRAQPRRARPPVGRATIPSTSCVATRTTSSRPASCSPSVTRSSLAVAIRTSRRGPTSCSSTPSRRRCGRRPSTRSSTSPRQCDGVRCDMAMLMLNDVFAAHMGRAGRAGRRPPSTGPDVIDGVRGRAPRTSCSSPRPTGTWRASSSSSASTTATTSGSTTGCVARGRRRGPRPPAAPTSTTSAGSCGSSRTTTSPAPRPSSRPDAERAAAVAIATLPGRHAVARGAVRGPAGPPARVPRPAAPTSRTTRSCGPSTCGSSADDVRVGASGSGAMPSAGPTTTSSEHLLSWSWTDGRAARARRRELEPGAGPGPDHARLGRLPAARGRSPTCSPVRATTATAASSPGAGSTSSARAGALTCSGVS